MAKQRKRGLISPQSALETGKAAKGGGFTVRTTGTATGKPARDVLAVGFAPEGGRGEEVSVSPDSSAAVQVFKFNREKQDVLGSPGASMGQGGWFDPESGTVQQDSSVLLPRSPGGYKAAMHIGTYGQQAAIGNLGSSSYIGDIGIPEHLHKGQFVWNEDPEYPMAPRVEKATAMHRGREVPVTRITPSRLEMVEVESEETADKALGDKLTRERM
jgi:hypothetical protein